MESNPNIYANKISRDLLHHKERLEQIFDSLSLGEENKCRNLFFLIKIESFVDLFSRVFAKAAGQHQLYKNSDNYSLEREWFITFFREFCFLYSSRKDHDKIFGSWTVRNTAEEQYHISSKIFDVVMEEVVAYVDRNRSARSNKCITGEQIESFVFQVFLNRVFCSYLDRSWQWQDIKKIISNLHHSLKSYAEDYNAFCRWLPLTSNRECLSYQVFQSIEYYHLFNMFENDAKEGTDFLGCGIEIEFQVPSVIESFEILGTKLEEAGTKVAFKATAQSYQEGLGILAVDESLPNIPGYFPAEFSSPILRKESDVHRISSMIDLLCGANCCVDESAGIHVHVSREQLHLSEIKAIILGYARIEHFLRKAFYRRDREQDFNLYASSIFSFMFGDERKSDRIKSFLVLASFLDRSKTLAEIRDAIACGNKYCGLFLHNKYETIEFRGHPSSLKKERILNYLGFIQDFVGTAISRRSYNYLRLYAKNAFELRRNDGTKVMADQDMVRFNFNKFRFLKQTPVETYKRIQFLNARVSSEIIRTGKLPPPECSFDGDLSYKIEVLGIVDNISRQGA